MKRKTPRAMNKPLKRVTSFLLVLLFVLPMSVDLLNLLPVRAADEFVLLLNWEVTTSNNVSLSPDRADLTLTPLHNSVNQNTAGLSPHSVRLKLEFAPPHGVDALPGEVEVRVPMYIFKTRDGSNIVNTTLANSQGVHPVTAFGMEHNSGLYYEIDEDTDEYVFKNWNELTGGYYTVVYITYNYIPEKIKDGYFNGDITATAEFLPDGGSLDYKESAPLSVTVNTFVAPPASFSVNWYRTSDPSQFKYESWITTPSTPNFGARPAGSVFGSPYSVFTADDIGNIYLGDGKYVAYEDIGSEKYYYLIWEIKYQRRANWSTQPYYINIDIALSEAGGGEIVGICGNDVNNNADAGLNNLPFVGQAAAQINAAAVVSPSNFPSKTATVNLLTTPSAFDTRGDSYIVTMYRWVLVRYPRGEGEGLGYNVDETLSAKLTLTGIDHMDDPSEGMGSDIEDNVLWQTGETGAVTRPASPTAGRAYVGDPMYTHVREVKGPVYIYTPVVHTYSGGNYNTLKYDIGGSYANNSTPTVYSAINRLSEGSVTNPVSVSLLRTAADAYSFRLRAAAQGWALTRADPEDIIPDIDSHDPRNYYKKNYTVELTDGMVFLREVRLTKDDYAITRSYLTYTEYVHTFNPNNGNLTAYEVAYYDGNPTPAQLEAMSPYAQVAPYAPIEIWYKTIYSGDNWLKAGEVKRTAASVYTYTTADGTQLENPSLPMSSGNQLKLPYGTYEIKYIHTSSRFQVVIDSYFTVDLYSTNRVLALLDGGTVDGLTYGRTDSAQLRNIHSMAVIDSAGAVRNFVPLTSIYASSYPGGTGVTVADNVSPSFYQNSLYARSADLYPSTPAGQSVMQYYTYFMLNRTAATTVIEKFNTADRKDASNAQNGYATNNTITDDGAKGLRSIHQQVRVYDQIYYNPSLVPGSNREERMEDLADNNIFKQLTEGTFYDLLPPGTYIDEDVEAFTWYTDPYYTNSNATIAAAARAAHEANRQDALVNWYTVDNWQGSGRTMLIVNVKAPEATNYQVYDAPAGTTWTSPSGDTYVAGAAAAASPLQRIAVNALGYERIMSGFVINYNLVTTYSNIFDRSDAQGIFYAYNVAAFRNKTGRLASGPNGVPTSAAQPWGNNVNHTGDVSVAANRNTTAPLTNRFFMALESDYPTRDDNTGTYNTAYIYSTTNFLIPDAYQYGVSKNVRSQSDLDFVKEAETIPGGLYQYQLHFLSGPSKYYTEIKIYDILENEPDSEWKGVLDSVDTSFAKSLGCAPVVYYSTIPAEELEFISGPVSGVYSTTAQAEFDAQYLSEDIWTDTMPYDKSTITAIAVDFTLATNGSNFQLTKGDSIYVVVNMLAPTDAAEYEDIILNNQEAKNRIGYSTVEVNPYNLSDKSSTVRWSEPTVVTIREVEFDIGKTSFPASGTSSDMQAVDRGDSLVYTVAVMNKDILPLSGVTVKDVLPEGVMLASGDIRYYTGTDPSKAVVLPGWITLERNWAPGQTQESGQTEADDGLALTFVIDNINAQQTIHLVIPVTVDPEIAFGSVLTNSAVVTEINGAEYDIESETTYHQVYPRVTLEGSVRLDERHLRVNEFEFVLIDNNSGPTNGDVLSQVKNDKYGNFVFTPLGFKDPGTYTYIIAELPNTVPSSNLPSGAPGEVDYDITTYTVTITVTKDSITGEMETEVTIVKTGETAESDIEFNNVYIPDPVYMPFELNKILNGRNIVGSEFKFTITDADTGIAADVYDAGGNIIAGGLESNSSGMTSFRLKFTAPGTYVYEVKEVNNSLPNVAYDGEVFTVTVVVEKTSVDPNSSPTPINSVQRNDGRLSVPSQPEILDSDSQNAHLGFTNTFTPSPVTAQIQGTKALTGGRDLVGNDFSFVLTDVTDPLNPVIKQTVNNDAAGNIVFSPITYTDKDAGIYGKTFLYTVTEVVPEPKDPNITYAALVNVSVVISIDRDLGVLSSSITNQNFVMTNTYTPDPVSVSFAAQKIYEGGSLAAGQFSFRLRDTNDPRGEIYYYYINPPVTNGADGSVEFPEFKYTATGTYTYQITETPGADAKIKYDPTVYNITVVVTQNAAGQIEVAAPVYSGGGAAVFTNTRIHDVMFKPNYGDNTTIDVESVENGESIYSYGSSDMPADPTRPGWIFKGWNTKPDGTGTDFDEDIIITEDTTVYAIWEAIEYTVIFDWNDGGATSTPDETMPGFYYEDTVDGIGNELPNSPTWPGYTFKGWNTEADGSGTQFNEDTPVTASITVYAVWEIDDYTVIYAPGDHGTWDYMTTLGAFTEHLHYGDTTPVNLSLSGDLPCEPGWRFIGWSPVWKDTVTGSVTYVAQWEAIVYTVTFDGNGGTPSVPYVSGFEYNDSFDSVGKELPPPLPRPGYIFLGWNFERDGDGADFDEETLIKGIVTVYAQWEAIEYTVVYEPGDHGDWDTAGDAGYIFDSLLYGESTPLPMAIPGEPGWTFIRWAPDWSDTINENVTYTAQWSKDAYTVTFDGNGGEPYIKTVPGFEYDDTFDTTGYNMPSPPPDRPGYVFRGWSTGQAEGSAIDFDENTPIGGSITIYAQWEAIEYTVKYYPGDYGDWAPDEPGYTTEGLHYGDSTPMPATVTSLDGGWHFAKWSPVWSDNVTDDVIYTALWVNDPDLLIVSFHPGTGGLFQSEDCEPVPSGNLTPYPSSAPSSGTAPIGETGWVFAGWLPVANGVALGEPVFDFEGITVTDHVDYIAQWMHDPDLYTVAYDPGEGGNWNSAEGGVYNFTNLQYGEPTPPQPTSLPAKSGWIFDGWSPVWSNTVTGDVTYVAQWKKEDTPPSDYGYDSSWNPPPQTTTVTTPEPEPESDAYPDTDLDPDMPVPDPLEEYMPELPEEPFAEQPPEDRLLELPLNIVLPEGASQEDFPSIDLNAQQSDMSQPGGDDSSAPPVPNYSDNMLMVQIDVYGNIFFLEITDPNSPPLGMWVWSEEDGEWIFIDMDMPLGLLPATGKSPIVYCFALTGLSLLSVGFLVRRKSFFRAKYSRI